MMINPIIFTRTRTRMRHAIKCTDGASTSCATTEAKDKGAARDNDLDRKPRVGRGPVVRLDLHLLLRVPAVGTAAAVRARHRLPEAHLRQAVEVAAVGWSPPHHLMNTSEARARRDRVTSPSLLYTSSAQQHSSRPGPR